MISVVIPTKDSEEALARTLATLVPAAAEGIVREVVVVDGGSSDSTALVADGTGCLFVSDSGAIDGRLAEGAEMARRGDWLMFLPPGVLLEPGWERDFLAFSERIDRIGNRKVAAVFRFGLDDLGFSAGVRQTATRLMGRITGVPHPDQGLLIPRSFYREIGGFRRRGALCAADLFRRIGRSRLVRLRIRACRVIADPQTKALLVGGGFRARLMLGLLTLRVPVPVLRRVFR